MTKRRFADRLCRSLVLWVSAFSVAHAQAPAAGPAGTTQHRVTVGNVVDMPNLVRLDGEAINGRIESMDADSVTVRQADGVVVQVARPRRTIAGVLASAGGDTVTLQRAHLPVLTIPRVAIVKLERLDGHKSRGRSAGLGFLLGAAGGGTVGLIIGNGCQSKGAFSLNCFGEPASSAMAGVILAGGAGAIIGAFTPRLRWTEISPSLLPPHRP